MVKFSVKLRPCLFIGLQILRRKSRRLRCKVQWGQINISICSTTIDLSSWYCLYSCKLTLEMRTVHSLQ